MTLGASLTRMALAGGVFLLATGCESVTDSQDRELLSQLRQAELRWVQTGVLNYSIVVQRLCFCGYTRPVRVTVRQGQVVSRIDAETGEVAPPQASNVTDVRGLFVLIRDAIDRNAHSLAVTYDGATGIPQQINIDYIGNAVDDELSVKTSEFQPAN